jgi:ABC-2 type transport system ATP-binding protein
VSPVLEIQGLAKTFRSGLSRKVVRAVVELNLVVEAGSVVAFVGPNGAGKTTTLLAILGFLNPDRGSIRVFGEPSGSIAARRRIGFQSEIFHTYPFHTARRALSFYGRLSGLSRAETERRSVRQLERLGLAEAADRKVHTFSKGMTQRLGLAQALLHEPDLLLLDEPTTGLDPEGRKLVADLILEEKARGRTIFLSSHILTDVERTCDRVVMIRKGEVVLSEDLRTLSVTGELWEVELRGGNAEGLARIAERGLAPEHEHEHEREGDGAALFRCSAAQKTELLRLAAELGLDVSSVRRHANNLEDLYMKHLGGTSDG